MSASRTFYETDSAREARWLAAALSHIGLEIEVAPGRVRRYAVREKTRWDRAFLAWRKGLGRLLQGARL